MSAYDAIRAGETLPFGTYEFTAERIKTWARQWDPQLFHIDEAAAAKTIYGRLIASGWHTCAVLMRLQVDYFKDPSHGMLLRFGPSPGFEDLKWLKPVYAGDRLTYAGTVTEKRLSRSRPGMAIVTTAFTAVNQNGETVLSMTAHVFVWVG
jgi:acyl dehydratase